MNVNITTQHECVILDACCIMNLYASGKMADIISSIAETMAVAVYVMKVEALTIYVESKSSVPNEKEFIDLQPLISKGMLMAADIESNEENLTFIEFTSQRMDDGEAITMAIAVNRNWAIATDDRMAKRIFNTEHNNQIISTPEIMKHWQENGKLKPDVLRQAIINIEKRANYLLGSRHPLYAWWQSCKE